MKEVTECNVVTIKEIYVYKICTYIGTDLFWIIKWNKSNIAIYCIMIS